MDAPTADSETPQIDGASGESPGSPVAAGQAPVPPANAMTIDVEEYFQVGAFESFIPRDSWDDFESRVEPAMNRFFDLLGETGAKATMFFLGWVAERHPGLVRRAIDEGHEIASHGYDHKRAFALSRDEFRHDVSRTRKMLEDIGGVRVKGYRAPNFSISADNIWALDILAEEEYLYSSSIYPVRHDHYGMPEAPRFAFRANGSDSAATGSILELPMTTIRVAGRNLPGSGGGYFRLLPYSLSRWAFRRVNRADRQPGIFYCHPWEFDPDQPRQNQASARSRFRHYVNLHTTEKKFRRLLRDFNWGRMDDIFLDQTR